MNANEFHPSRYLKAADVGDNEDFIVTIRDVKKEMIGAGADQSLKPCLRFHETTKLLVLNKTNVNTLMKLYGNETDDWVGMKVALYVTEVQFQSDMVPSIRIRSRVPAVTAVRSNAAPQTRPRPMETAPPPPHLGPVTATNDDSDITY